MNTKTRALEAGQNVAQLPLPRIGGWKSRRSDTCEPLAVSAEEQSQPTPNQPPPNRIESPGLVAQSTTSLIDRRQLLLPYNYLLLANCSTLTRHRILTWGCSVPDRTGPGQSSSVPKRPQFCAHYAPRAREPSKPRRERRPDWRGPHRLRSPSLQPVKGS